jgi:hypothetical protein
MKHNNFRAYPYLSKVSAILLIVILNCAFYPSNSKDYLKDPLLLEIINADWIAFRQEVEICASEVEKENEREIVFLTYLIDDLNSSFSLIPYEDSKIRGEKLLQSLNREGIQETVLNGRHLFAGRPSSSSDWEIRKKELKERIANGANNCFHKEYFAMTDYSIMNEDKNFKLKINLKAKEEIKEIILKDTKVLIFTILDEIESKNCLLPHKNVAYKFISLKGFENEKFDGTGNRLSQIVSKNFISEGENIDLESVEFNIDNTKNKNWSIVLIIENDKRREILLTRKLKLVID